MAAIKTERVKLANGKVYEIPVGADGCVPQAALLQRFNEVVEARGHVRNKAKDYDQEAAVVLPLQLTPREAAAWWDTPNRYDIQYIDAPGPVRQNLDYIKDPAVRKVHENLELICLPSEEREVRKLIDQAYSLAERQQLVKNGKVTVTVRPLADAAGNILGRRIELDRETGKNNSTVVHEGLHLLRKDDPGRKGVTKSAVGERKIASLDRLNLEESCTVAEQMARGEQPSSGYYHFVQVFDEQKKRWRYPTEKEALAMMKSDRLLFTNGQNKPLRGKAAVKAVEENWSHSHIARLKIKGAKKMAREEFSQTKLQELGKKKIFRRRSA